MHGVCLSANPSTGKQRQKILEVHWPAGLADQLEILSQKLRLGGGGNREKTPDIDL